MPFKKHHNNFDTNNNCLFDSVASIFNNINYIWFWYNIHCNWNVTENQKRRVVIIEETDLIQMQHWVNFRVASGPPVDGIVLFWIADIVSVFRVWFGNQSLLVGYSNSGNQYLSDRWQIYLCFFLFAITDICLSTGWILIFRIYRNLIWWVINNFWS